MVLDPTRQAALVALRAAALVRDHFHLDIAASDWSVFGSTGAIAGDEGRIFGFPASADQVGLGAVLAWASTHNPTSIEVVFEADEDLDRLAVLARQAKLFKPPINIWQMADNSLHSVSPLSYEMAREPSASALALVPLLSNAALEVVVEDGQVIGEIRGLEVARVVEPNIDEGTGVTARVEVGIGRFDREAFALMHSDVSVEEALARVSEQVRQIRRPGAEPHPLNRLARERWLRAQLMLNPALVEAQQLVVAASAVVRGGLRENAIAVAEGTAKAAKDGGAMVVVTSTGVNLEAVVEAADARARLNPSAKLILVVPPSDDFAVTRRIMNLLKQPGQVIPVEGEWSGATP